MRKISMLLLPVGLFAACQAPDHEEAIRRPAHGATVAKTLKSPVDTAQKSTEMAIHKTKKPAPPAAAYHEPDSLRAFLGTRPMRFQCVTDEALRLAIQEQSGGVDTVFGRYLIIRQLFEPTRVLYRATPAATCWTQVQLESVGDMGAVGGELTLDTVQLDPQRRVLLLNLRGHNGFWGGSLDYGLTNLIDVTANPQLLLKTEALRENTGYGRMEDTVYDDDAAGSEKREQNVRVRQGMIWIAPARQSTRSGRLGAETASREPLPETMLPAGRYRYQNGKVLRVK